MPLASGQQTGSIVDAAGVTRVIQRAFAGSAGAALGINLVVPAQGAGVKIRLLTWQVQYNAFPAMYSCFYSGAATQISALLPFQGVVTYQWQTFCEHGYFETNANEALNYYFTVAGAPWGINVLWIPTT